MSQFTSNSPYYQCIAVSQTADPTGAYYRYAFNVGGTTTLYDYPHFGVWPDGYYMSANRFGGASGSTAVVFDRARMLSGLSATYQERTLGGDSILPADLDGATLPPAGADAYFVRSIDGAPDRLEIRRMNVDWVTPPTPPLPWSPISTQPLSTPTFALPTESSASISRGPPPTSKRSATA
jgi:hypothetical protein